MPLWRLQISPVPQGFLQQNTPPKMRMFLPCKMYFLPICTAFCHYKSNKKLEIRGVFLAILWASILFASYLHKLAFVCTLLDTFPLRAQRAQFLPASIVFFLCVQNKKPPSILEGFCKLILQMFCITFYLWFLPLDSSESALQGSEQSRHRPPLLQRQALSTKTLAKRLRRRSEHSSTL